jgi:hypothetical protein
MAAESARANVCAKPGLDLRRRPAAASRWVDGGRDGQVLPVALQSVKIANFDT